MPQTTLENYFNSRKRHAVDDIKKVNEKVLILDKNVSNTSKEVNSKQRTVIYQESPKSSSSKLCTAPKLHRRTPKTVSRSFIQGSGEKCTVKSSTRKSLLSTFNATESEEKKINNDISFKSSGAKKSLLLSFEASCNEKEEIIHKGVKQCSDTLTSSSSNENSEKTLKKSISKEIPLDNPTEDCASKSAISKTLEKLKNKDFDLGKLKKKIIKSSRLEDLKKALKKVNESTKKLEETQSRNQPAQETPSKSPSLQQFKAIELEVSSPLKMIPSESINKNPDSPSLLRKSIFMSPCKTAPNSQPYISPRKLFSESINSALKSPEKLTNSRSAYERFYALACSGKPAFTLPYKYRSLAETFRAVDTVVSMMYNRKETTIFSKLKLSVQQLSKKNLNESHIGQIETIFPKAYSFTQEKFRVFGNQNENYELVIKPLFENKEEDKDKMNPSVLLERRRMFYNTLLEMVKSQHEEFLKTLDPPLIVPKEKLTRWHPEFDVENCPDITVASLPQPPNIEKCSTAKDVLSKAKDVFCANPRMEKALQKLNESNKTNTKSTCETIPALTNALKGIPKSLLEKVRARQAAKAMELLTRNPEENKRRYELTRLPELARILRNIFITQKKNIIIKSIVLQKMCESFREIIDQSDMSHHLDLLREAVPGWILPTIVDNKEFLKLSKDTDMSEIMSKLNRLIEKNSVN